MKIYNRVVAKGGLLLVAIAVAIVFVSLPVLARKTDSNGDNAVKPKLKTINDGAGGGGYVPPPEPVALTIEQQMREGYKYLPVAKFPSGILLNIGSVLSSHLVKKANGVLPAVLSDASLTMEQFWNAYGDVQRSYVGVTPKQPAYLTLHSQAQSYRQNNINPLSLVAIKYQNIDPVAAANGRLNIVDKYGVVIPQVISPTEPTNDVQGYLSETSLGETSSYTTSDIFFGASFFSEDVFGDNENNIVLRIPPEFVITNSASGTVSTVSDIHIKFPDLALPTVPQNTYLPLTTGTNYFFNMANAALLPNATTTVEFVLRATVDGVVQYASRKFTYLGPDNRGYDCSVTNIEARYPALGKPTWWPLADWNSKPADPLVFFSTEIRPTYWPAQIPWPTLGVWYSTGTGIFGVDFFGFVPLRNDPSIIGPSYGGTPGKLYTRLYPATYRAGESQIERCKAKNLVLILDGFDVLNDRTPDTVYRDFGVTLRKMRDKGYDLLLIDYDKGQDHIQRNALVLMEVLKTIPSYMHDGYTQQKAIMLAGSMGTQVARTALAKLEEQGIDHHTGLWIAVDGPFVGAHVPWAIQGFLQLFSKVNEGANLRKLGMESPAARQLIRRHLELKPDSLHVQYYNEAHALNGGTGLPAKLRKVAIASGSGRGNNFDGNLAGRDPLPFDEPYGYIFDKVTSIGLSTLWYGVNVNAVVENNVSGGSVFKAKIVKPLYDYTTIPTGHSFKQVWDWTMSAGVQPLDYTPGGFNTAPTSTAASYNADSPSAICCMVSYLENFSFIPTFSSLYYKGAGNGASTEALNWKKDENNLLDSGTIITANTTQPVITNPWYGPEDPALFPSVIDPNVEQKSPFDAIWYQVKSHEHVVQSGAPAPIGEDAFLFNEMDMFSSQEGFSNRVSADPKVPSSDIFLSHFRYLSCGEFCGTAVGNNLFAINTMTKKAMLQEFDANSGSFTTIWDAGTSGAIGNWTLDKGDKFYLMNLNDPANPTSQMKLLSISASTPARAMVQTLTIGPAEGQAVWSVAWDNNSNGYLGTWKLHSTDIMTVGDMISEGGGSVYDELVVASPYIGNESRERQFPGRGGRSKVALLRFVGGAQGWQTSWDNYNPIDVVATINFLGNMQVRFGDFIGFGKFDSLLSPYPGGIVQFSQLRNLFTPIGQGIFGTATPQNEVVIQVYDNSSKAWPAPWNNDYNVNGYGDGRIGTWTLGNVEDAFHLFDMDGDGSDELMSVNPDFLHIQSAPTGGGADWTLRYFTDATTGKMFGSHLLRKGDRFYTGNIDVPLINDAVDEVLVLNPITKTPPVLQSYNISTNSWTTIYSSGTTMLGAWQLYEH